MNYYLNEKVDDIMVITSDYDMQSNIIKGYMKNNLIPKLYLDTLGCNGINNDDRFLEYIYDGNNITCNVVEDKIIQRKIAEVTFNFHKEHNFEKLNNTVLINKEKEMYKIGKFIHISIGEYL